MAGQNPYERYLSKEQVMQAETARLLALRFPNLFWWHTPNEGKRTPYEQYLFKQMGGLKGVSDFVVLEESNFSKGLMIEIKWGKNPCTIEQVDFLIRSAKKGFMAAVVWDDARDVLSLVEKHLAGGVGIPDEGIILIKGGKQSLVPFAEAHKVLCKKTKEEATVEKVKKMFGVKSKSKKVDRSKLFSHPKLDS